MTGEGRWEKERRAQSRGAAWEKSPRAFLLPTSQTRKPRPRGVRPLFTRAARRQGSGLELVLSFSHYCG